MHRLSRSLLQRFLQRVLQRVLHTQTLWGVPERVINWWDDAELLHALHYALALGVAGARAFDFLLNRALFLHHPLDSLEAVLNVYVLRSVSMRNFFVFWCQ